MIWSWVAVVLALLAGIGVQTLLNRLWPVGPVYLCQHSTPPAAAAAPVAAPVVTVAPEQPSFTCPHCFETSDNPSDVAEGYCPRCHDWTGRAAPRVAPYINHERPLFSGLPGQLPAGGSV